MAENAIIIRRRSMSTHDAPLVSVRPWLAVAVLLLGGAASAWAQDPALPAANPTRPVLSTPGPAAEAVKPAAEATTAAQTPSKSWMDIYGFAMLDIGENFTRINPDWYDTLRVSKLPSFNDEFGKNGDAYAGVRQTRFGVKTSTPTGLGDLKT